MGYLQEQPVEQNIPPDQRQFASARLDCGGSEITAWFYGEEASWIAGVPADSAIAVSGRLVTHKWKAGKIEREKIVVRVTQTTLVERANERA